jgi:hypothetical protein
VLSDNPLEVIGAPVDTVVILSSLFEDISAENIYQSPRYTELYSDDDISMVKILVCICTDMLITCVVGL